MSVKEQAAPTVVIGAGPVGMHVARKLSRRRTVIVFDAMSDAPGSTALRTQFSHQFDESDWTGGPVAECPPGLSIRNGCRIVRIDRARHRLITAKGEVIVYAQLILALGAAPVRPGFADADISGLQTAYSQDDFVALAAATRTGQRIAIVGGGLLAVELASRLARKATVQLYARGPLLRHYANLATARRVGDQLQRLGVQVQAATPIARVASSADGIDLYASDGQRCNVDRVVLACGLQARTALAMRAGLAVTDGIRVDQQMRTEDQRIWAVGDCIASSGETVHGNVHNAIANANRAIAAILDQSMPANTRGVVVNRRVDMGTRVFVHIERVTADNTSASMRTLNMRALALCLRAGRLVRCQGLVSASTADVLQHMASEQLPVPHWRIWLMRIGIIPHYKTRNDNPVVCHCAGVRKNQILYAMRQGVGIEQVTRLTGAGQQCGACFEQVAALVGGRQSRRFWHTTLLSLLVLSAVIGVASVPVWSAGDSVQTWLFSAFMLLSERGVRQLSGYTSAAFALLALCAVFVPRQKISSRRRREQHIVLGVLGLAVLPLHVLGGITVGAGLNILLPAAFVLCSLLGLVALATRLRKLGLWPHMAMSAVLVALVGMHVAYIYQY